MAQDRLISKVTTGITGFDDLNCESAQGFLFGAATPEPVLAVPSALTR